MSYTQLPEKTSSDTNAAADVNLLQDNIEALKGGAGATAPTTNIEALATQQGTNTSNIGTNTSDISDNADAITLLSVESTAKSADYTILDDDGFQTILMTTGSSTDKTVTLPTAADNADREITILKADAGTNHCIVDGEGAETINGTLVFTIFSQYTGITVKSDGTGWNIIKIIGSVEQTDTDSTIRVISSPSNATWYQPSGSNLQVTVEPGIYNIIAQVVGQCQTSKQILLMNQLDTDTGTPGGGLLVSASVSQQIPIDTSGGADQYTAVLHASQIKFTVSTTIRISERISEQAGSTTLTNLYHRNDRTPGRITAERIG